MNENLLAFEVRCPPSLGTKSRMYNDYDSKSSGDEIDG